MGKKTGSWDRPIQGVSQQTDKDRISGQCTLQENFTPSPLYGLKKRVGSKHISKLFTSLDPLSLIYSYSRGNEEDYLIVIEPESYPRVFDIQGNEKVVNVGTVSDTYLKVENPVESFATATIADYTFLLNKGVTVLADPTLTQVNPALAIVYCQYATYGRDYIIKANGVEIAKYTTRDGSVSSHISDVKTNNVVQRLASQITTTTAKVESALAYLDSPDLKVNTNENVSYINTVTNRDRGGAGVEVISFSSNVLILNAGDASAGELLDINYSPVGATAGEYTSEVFGNTIYVTRVDGARFSIETVDGSDGDDLIAVQDRVSNVSKLPPYAPEGYVIKIQNNEGFDANSYWLKATTTGDTTDQTGSEIRWIETLAQGEKYKLDMGTMPHTLISESDGSFTLSYGEWEDKKVGNELTNPYPSFLGNNIQSIGTFQNRLVVTSREAAVFSRSNLFFNFFRESTQTETDADPIDVFADSDDINFLVHSSVLDGDIVFFAENGQFLISGNSPITKGNIIFKRVTSYPFNIKAKPAVTGESVMFSFSTGKYAGVREMFTDSLTDTKRARPITEHVAEYIDGVPLELTTSPNINKLVIRTDKSDNTLYVYDWLWSGEQKVQSAFHKWVMSGTIMFTKFIRDELYLVIDRGDGVYLESVPIANDEDDNGLDFSIRADRRYDITASYSGDKWMFTVPYALSEDAVLVLGEGCWESDKGTSINWETDGTLYWSYDDLADVKSGVLSCGLILGSPFTSKYIPTQPFIVDQNGRVNDIDRFTLNTVTVNYVSTGNLHISVKDKSSRREWKYEYNGRRMNSYTNKVGFAPLDAGSYKFPVRLLADSSIIELSSDDYRPLIIRDMSWDGQHKQRGQRL